MSGRVVRNLLLYGAVAGFERALGWPENVPLTWRFYVGIAFAVGLTWKGLYSDGAKEKGETVDVNIASQAKAVETTEVKE